MNQDENRDNFLNSDEEIKKEKKEFNLKIDNEINKIPDYQLQAHSSKKKKKRFSIFARVMFAIIVVGLSVFLAIGIIFAAQDAYGINKPDQKMIVEIPQNSATVNIAKILEERGVINSSFVFRAYVKLSRVNPNYQYGTYSLNSNMPYDLIIEELSKYSKTKTEVRVTFPEGTTVLEAADLLEKKKVCKKVDFINAIQTVNFEYEFEKNIPANDLRYYKLEGYLFPDTYNFFENDNPINVADKMLKNYNKKMNEQMIEKMKKSGFSQDDLITIASIVQKEAGKTEQMKKVASVYLNRLKNKEDFANLQACPTRDYANGIKGEMSVINQKILDAYNTYEGQGLPPGPICNPGIEAINAVLEPEDTPYYYFCTNLKTGEFYYAETLKQHNKNVQKAGLRQ